MVHDQSQFASPLAFAENVYSLPPLTCRDTAANHLLDAFDSLSPLLPAVLNLQNVQFPVDCCHSWLICGEWISLIFRQTQLP